MKLAALILAFVLTSIAQAFPLNVTWDAVPDPLLIDGYNIYLMESTVQNGNQTVNIYVKVNPLLITGTQFQIPDAQSGFKYVVRSVNFIGESPDSNVLVVPNLPPPPGNFRFLKVLLEKSADLKVWMPLAMVDVTKEQQQGFFRLRW